MKSVRKNILTLNRVRRFRARRAILNQPLIPNDQNIAMDFTPASEIEHGKDDTHQKAYPDLIRSWVNVHGITTRAVNDLLRILRLAGLIFSENQYLTISVLIF